MPPGLPYPFAAMQNFCIRAGHRRRIGEGSTMAVDAHAFRALVEQHQTMVSQIVWGPEVGHSTLGEAILF